MKKALWITALMALLFLLAKVVEYVAEYYNFHYKFIELKRRW